MSQRKYNFFSGIINSVSKFNETQEHRIKIAFIHTQVDLPSFCCIESFNPKPRIGCQVNENFIEIMNKEYSFNKAIHDGAMAFYWDCSPQSLPVLSAWGVRLFPPVLCPSIRSNRGMAYNSALQFSAVGPVKSVFLFEATGFLLFENGNEAESWEYTEFRDTQHTGCSTK